MLSRQPAALRITLEQIEQATQHHLEWHANLLRAIVCELPGDPDDLSEDAHRLCRFGRWYYQRASDSLREHPVFAAVGLEHRHVHEIAARLLREIAAGRSVPRSAFDELVAGSLRLRAELERLRRDLLSELRRRDPLTGAFDRNEVLPELRRWRPPLATEPVPCCVVLVDLDGVAEINAARGHLTGDALLAEAVRFLHEHLRPDDKVFRYGGDEFLLTLPRTDLAEGREIVTRLRDGLAGHELFIAGAGPTYHLTASFGIALLDPEIRVEDSVEHAGQALLLAKAAGGNRLIAWDPSITTGRHWRRIDADRATDPTGSSGAAKPSSRD
jgi:diguanylate cyclase (GGDEF)-like protein